MEVAGLTRATPESEEGGLPSAPCGSGQEGSTCYLARYFQPAVGTANAVSPRLAPASRADSARLNPREAWEYLARGQPRRVAHAVLSTRRRAPRRLCCRSPLASPTPFAVSRSHLHRRLIALSHVLTSTAIHRRLTLTPPPPSIAVARSHL